MEGLFNAIFQKKAKNENESAKKPSENTRKTYQNAAPNGSGV